MPRRQRAQLHAALSHAVGSTSDIGGANAPDWKTRRPASGRIRVGAGAGLCFTRVIRVVPVVVGLLASSADCLCGCPAGSPQL